jgi:hypothetical protein
MDAIATFIAESHKRDSVEISVASAGDGQPPLVNRTAELVQGLGNFIDNAADFASKRVEIEIEWDEQDVGLTISDDGPGFPAGVLGLLGIRTSARGPGREEWVWVCSYPRPCLSELARASDSPTTVVRAEPWLRLPGRVP